MRLIQALALTSALVGTSCAAAAGPVAATTAVDTRVSMVKEDQPRISALREYSIGKGIADGRQMQFQAIRLAQMNEKSKYDALYQVDHLYIRPTKLVERITPSGAVVKKEVDDPAFKGFLIQPPVILTGTDLMQLQKTGKSIDWSQIRFEFATNAQFVTAPINWQTYFVNDEDVVRQGPPDDPLFKARTPEEQQLMDTFYKIALDEGKSQATEEVKARIKTLTTIIVGMTNYHVLSSKNLVQKAEVATGYVPVSGNKTQLTLSTLNARVTRDAEFNLQPETYKPFVNAVQ